jgi:hypothetical protein
MIPDSWGNSHPEVEEKVATSARNYKLFAKVLLL